jgi:hypothetical protein
MPNARTRASTTTAKHRCRLSSRAQRWRTIRNWIGSSRHPCRGMQQPSRRVRQIKSQLGHLTVPICEVVVFPSVYAPGDTNFDRVLRVSNRQHRFARDALWKCRKPSARYSMLAIDWAFVALDRLRSGQQLHGSRRSTELDLATSQCFNNILQVRHYVPALFGANKATRPHRKCDM